MAQNANKIAAVTAALINGPYRLELSLSRPDSAYVYGPSGVFVDTFGQAIRFERLDAEKLVRLYNEDAHREP